MYKWLYKDTIESGEMVILADVPAYLAKGWVDTPDNYVAPGEYVEPPEYAEYETKADLEEYAKTMYDVDLDRRKNRRNMIEDIIALGG